MLDFNSGKTWKKWKPHKHTHEHHIVCQLDVLISAPSIRDYRDLIINKLYCRNIFLIPFMCAFYSNRGSNQANFIIKSRLNGI